MGKKACKGWLGLTTVLAGQALAFEVPVGGDHTVHLGGYVRQYLSMNLSDMKDTPGDDQYDLSMARTTLFLNGDTNVGPFFIKGIFRVSREVMTSTLDDLRNQHNERFVPAFGIGRKSNFLDQYNENDLRELYTTFDVGPRVTVTFGRQQVVWGESDFFQAMDMVHGYDFRWRSFLEPENEELRKPLVLLNTIVKVPELNGNFQFLVRPGLDPKRSIGSNYDLFGGRWAESLNRGTDILAFVPYNYDHPRGDASSVSGGVRWAGIAGPVNYSFNYLHTFNTDPIVDSIWHPWGRAKDIDGAWGNVIYPEINVFGATANTYHEGTDTVYSIEVAYTPNKPFNVLGAPGSSDNALAPAYGQTLPGFGGVIQKNVLRWMVRADKNISLEKMIGTARPSLLSVQLFDTWVVNRDKTDQIVDLPGFAALKHEHAFILTGMLAMNYRYDTINPTLAGGWDATNGGGFVIPSVDVQYGNHWRLRFEGNFFFSNGNSNKWGDDPWRDTGDTHIFGYFANNNQLLTRLTYQF